VGVHGTWAHNWRRAQSIAVAQRHVELSGKSENHVRTRSRLPGLDQADVPCRDLGDEGELELAHPLTVPPLAQQFANGHHGTSALALGWRSVAGIGWKTSLCSAIAGVPQLVGT
jgi:hypothetical protein